jgi:hypothetical protein
MDERHVELTFLSDGLVDLLEQNADYLDAHDQHIARLATMATDVQKLQSDTVRQGQFDSEVKALQLLILQVSHRVAQSVDDPPDDDDPDRPPHSTGRTPTRGRSDRDQNLDRKKFRDHDGPVLPDIAHASMRTFYHLLGHLCHSCNIPLLPLDSIIATTLDLCPPNVPVLERKQHSMDLYFKLASNGILVKCMQTTTWLTMFAVRADGYGLLYELIFNAIPALSVTVPTFPTWVKYPDVYRLAAACTDYFQVDNTGQGNRRQAPRLQSMLYLSAIKDQSLKASIRMLQDRLGNCEHDQVSTSILVDRLRWFSASRLSQYRTSRQHAFVRILTV